MTLPARGSGPAIRVSDVSKAYPGVVALDRVSLTVSFGEIHAVIGLNGAGKSTLINVLAGSLEPDAGIVRVEGSARDLGYRSGGVSFVPQEILMVPTLSIGRNALLGSEGFMTRAEVSRREHERVGRRIRSGRPGHRPDIPADRMFGPRASAGPDSASTHAESERDPPG